MTDVVEIRGDVAREITDVIDAVARAHGISRMQQVARILDDWAEMKRHEATLVVRLTRSNGSEGES